VLRRDPVREAGDDPAETLARFGTRPGPELVIYSGSSDVRDTRQNGFIKRRRLRQPAMAMGEVSV
jgi:hypothetical protein